MSDGLCYVRWARMMESMEVSDVLGHVLDARPVHKARTTKETRGEPCTHGGCVRC